MSTGRINLKLGWIIAIVVLVPLIYSSVSSRWKLLHPSTPSRFDAARDDQATPESTVNTGFHMMFPGPDPYSMTSLSTQPFDDDHLLRGKDMTLDEKQFVELFWDHVCSAAIYHDIRWEHLTDPPSITNHIENGDSALVNVSALASGPPEAGPDAIPQLFKFELKKRGPNWYIAEMRTGAERDGVCSGVKRRLGE